MARSARTVRAPRFLKQTHGAPVIATCQAAFRKRLDHHPFPAGQVKVSPPLDRLRQRGRERRHLAVRSVDQAVLAFSPTAAPIAWARGANRTRGALRDRSRRDRQRTRASALPAFSFLTRRSQPFDRPSHTFRSRAFSGCTHLPPTGRKTAFPTAPADECCPKLRLSICQSPRSCLC